MNLIGSRVLMCQLHHFLYQTQDWQTVLSVSNNYSPQNIDYYPEIHTVYFILYTRTSKFQHFLIDLRKNKFKSLNIDNVVSYAVSHYFQNINFYMTNDNRDGLKQRNMFTLKVIRSYRMHPNNPNKIHTVKCLSQLGLVLLHGRSQLYVLDSIYQRLQRVNLNYDIPRNRYPGIDVYEQTTSAKHVTTIWVMNRRRIEIQLFQIEKITESSNLQNSILDKRSLILA